MKQIKKYNVITNAINVTPSNIQTKEGIKFWNFVKNEKDNTAELTVYGPIASTSWWEDEVTPIKFSNDLKSLGDISEITVRINSSGGDVFAANTIQNMLKDHKAKIKVKIDGLAASAATIIAMAGDEILIPDNGIFMIHNPSIGLVGHYNKSDFEDLINILDTTKKSIITSYAKRTGKEENEIANLMNKETWYVGAEAVESGFCDALTGETTENKVVNNFIINSGEFKNVPQKVKEILNKTEIKGEEMQDNKTQTSQKISNVKDLREKYPNLVDQIEKEAMLGERKRIEDIEAISMGGYEELINKAKFKEPITASELAVIILAKQKEQGSEFLQNRDEDIANSGVANVKIEATEQKTTNENKYDAIIDAKYPTKR